MAIEGFGVRVYYTTTATTYEGTPTWTEIEDTFDVTPPSVGESDDIDITTNGSSGKVKEYMGGLIEPGTFEFSTFFSDTEYASLTALLGITKGWKVELPDGNTGGGSTFLADGYIKGAPVETPMDGATKVTWTVKISGEVEFHEAP